MKKKLIEVALPLEAINREAAREKSIRHGHPSTIHLWWARRPLAACRAVIFGSLVDDPSSHPDKFPTVEAQEKERKRLFDIIERMVKWENSNNEHVLKEVREEILKSTDGNPPPIYDPFCGGGSIPLEAQRLGLKAYGSDLNPVAVLITKALIEIPPKFAGMAPLNPEEKAKPIKTAWRGSQGLAADIEYYGNWMRSVASDKLSELYPEIQLPSEYGDKKAKVVAWLWAKTIKCPNPACGCTMPLVKSLVLSTKKGKERYLVPRLDKENKKLKFEIAKGQLNSTNSKSKIGRGAKFMCLACGQAASETSIRDEFKAKRNGRQLLSIVADIGGGRIYLPSNEHHELIAEKVIPDEIPDEEMNQLTPNLVSGRGYGITHWHELFTNRQLVMLNTYIQLLKPVYQKIQEDVKSVNHSDEQAKDYAKAVTTYLGLAVSKLSDANTCFTRWKPSMDQAIATFARQALPMVWDFAESNAFNEAAGDFRTTIKTIVRVVNDLPATGFGSAIQKDATQLFLEQDVKVISTDPPYYDNIAYADLSDFFYLWIKRGLGFLYPDIFSTLMTPKSAELVATQSRFDGSKEKAKVFFEKGLRQVFIGLHKKLMREYPLSVYYAFKQSEGEQVEDDDTSEHSNIEVASTGWETMLEALLQSGFQINGTIPMRTELSNRSIASGTNALASSIVLICRPLEEKATITTRREFINCLKIEFPDALNNLKQGGIAATDLAQAAIGPGMAVFSRYSKVMEADGSPMSVRTALTLINQILDEVNSESEGDFDPDSRWAVSWFETHGFEEGAYGEAETLSKAKNTSTTGLVDAGVITSKAGKVRLIPIEALPEDWNPKSDSRLTVWEVTHHLIRTLETKGEEGAAALMKEVGAIGEVARDLAYRLYSICERKKWAKDALRYNGLIVAWSDVSRVAQSIAIQPSSQQMSLLS